MDKKLKTKRSHAQSGGDIFTKIRTVGVLAPNLDKVLDVDDIAMVIVIDKKKQKHLRISYPTKTLAQHHERMDLPMLGQDGDGCWWLTKCDESGGDLPHIVKECVFDDDCAARHRVEDLGPC